MTSTSLFDPTDERLSQFSKALGHPARIAIVKALARRKECICGEIVDELPLAQSTVSQHLTALKKAGIVKGRIHGVRSCYCLDWEKLDIALKEFTRFTEDLKALKSEDQCC